MTVTSAVATSVRAAAVPAGRAVRVPLATVRVRLVIVPTARRVARARMVIVRKVTGRVRKASGSGRGAIFVTARKLIVPKAIVRKAIVPKATVRGPSAIARMARPVVTVLMVIGRTATVPASSVRKGIAPKVIVRRATVRARSAIVRTARRVATVRRAIVPMAIVPARTAAPAASAAGVVLLSRL
jgi:hypothetical protein